MPHISGGHGAIVITVRADDSPTLRDVNSMYTHGLWYPYRRRTSKVTSNSQPENPLETV